MDLPPGTGDIQITLSQLCSFSGTAMVTTPHQLAMVDVAKGRVGDIKCIVCIMGTVGCIWLCSFAFFSFCCRLGAV
ncbi:hypothetical protein EON65_15795 [archaeon]|nr:MAG: hypothetical protein EON65_15795 [archaeon]